MIRLAFFAAAMMAATAALADETIILTIDNQSTLVVDRLNTFPVDEDGEAVEDNLGSLMEDLAPGAKAELALSMTRCGVVRLYASFADGRELEGDIDLCKERTITVRD